MNKMLYSIQILFEYYFPQRWYGTKWIIMIYHFFASKIFNKYYLKKKNDYDIKFIKGELQIICFPYSLHKSCFFLINLKMYACISILSNYHGNPTLYHFPYFPCTDINRHYFYMRQPKPLRID